MARRRNPPAVPAPWRNPWHVSLRTDETRKVLRDGTVQAEAELYREMLSPFQFREMMSAGNIPVRGSKGGYYLVGVWPYANTAQVIRVDPVASTNRRSYCFQVNGVSPLDAALAKVLILQADEALFLKVAK